MEPVSPEHEGMNPNVITPGENVTCCINCRLGVKKENFHGEIISQHYAGNRKFHRLLHRRGTHNTVIPDHR